MIILRWSMYLITLMFTLAPIKVFCNDGITTQPDTEFIKMADPFSPTFEPPTIIIPSDVPHPGPTRGTNNIITLALNNILQQVEKRRNNVSCITRRMQQTWDYYSKVAKSSKYVDIQTRKFTEINQQLSDTYLKKKTCGGFFKKIKDIGCVWIQESSRLRWSVARDTCRHFHGNLMSRDDAELEALQKYLSKEYNYRGKTFWMGGKVNLSSMAKNNKNNGPFSSSKRGVCNNINKQDDTIVQTSRKESFNVDDKSSKMVDIKFLNGREIKKDIKPKEFEFVDSSRLTASQESSTLCLSLYGKRNFTLSYDYCEIRLPYICILE